MNLKVTDLEISIISNTLKNYKMRASKTKIKDILHVFNSTQQIFSPLLQKTNLVRMFKKYFSSKKSEIIILEELSEKLPITVTLGVLAEDWPGMSNSILGIIHHEERNVQFVKGFTTDYGGKKLGIVLLAFQIFDKKQHENYILNKKDLIKKISQASQGTLSKEKILDDEVVKLEIYNSVIHRIKKSSISKKEIEELIVQSGEALKFITCRSREYLEERKIQDLVSLIIDNHQLTKAVRKGDGVLLKINNFITKYESLTGITMVCKEKIISIEEFLETLEFLVPHYMIKHHKSFVTSDKIMVYRLEITDRNEKPLKKELIKSIQKTLSRMIFCSYNKDFSSMKSIGGFEHFARAIIPFLIEEFKKTGIPQAFINSDKKTAFVIDLRLIIVSEGNNKLRHRRFIQKLISITGFNLNMIVPPKKYYDSIEILILKLQVDLSIFSALNEIYTILRTIIEKYYGPVRDFDKGFREIDMFKLKQLNQKLPDIPKSLISEIFFAFEELYRIEKPIEVMVETVRLCFEIISKSEQKSNSSETFLKFNNLVKNNLILLVVSCIDVKYKRVLRKVLKQLRGIKIYFSMVEWNQRSYLILILGGGKEIMTKELMKELSEQIEKLIISIN